MTPRWCRAAVVVIPTRDRRSLSTKEVLRERTDTASQLLPEGAQAHCVAGLASNQEGLLMKTIACRFEDGLFDLLSITAELEGTSVAQEIREAVEAHVHRKATSGVLEAKAAEAMAEIDQEAKDRKSAIAILIGKPQAEVAKKAPAAQRRGKSTGSEPAGGSEEAAPKPRANPVGFAPPARTSDK
jgi:hypothetical protein